MRRAVVVALTASVLALVPNVGSQASSGFTFFGSGWGHGLGMSQYGAYGLAREGWSHRRILRQYYRGTTVGRAHRSPSSLRIGLVQEATSVHVKAAHGSVRLRLGNPASGTVVGGRAIPSGKTWSITIAGSGAFRVADDKGTLVWRGGGSDLFVSYLSSAGRAHIRETGHTYGRGYLEVDSYSGDGCWRGYCLRAIAVLSPQGYLDGLAEVPSSWPKQALMAQADAARTYAFEKVGRLGQHRSRCNCGLYASTWDQAYIGWDKESGSQGARWVSAVGATNGEVILFHGAPIQAYYTSSSGGFTESNQNVWGGSPIPYLRGACDPGDYTVANPNRTWRVGPLSAFKVTSSLRPFTGSIGTVTGFTQIQRGVSGRIIALTVVGASRRVTISGSTLKWALGLRDDRAWINVNKNVTGQIRHKYDSLSCAPGLPAGPQIYVPGGRLQQFANGVIYWNGARRHAYWLHGPILGYYLRAGGPRGYLGLPASDLMKASRGGASARFGSGIVVTCRGGTCSDQARVVPKIVTHVSSPWFQPRIGTDVSWGPRGGSGGGLVYEVRYRSAPWGKPFGPSRVWKRGTSEAADVFQGRMGSTYCFSARARDADGHHSAWSPASCSTVPLDDIGIARGGGWRRSRGNVDFYRGTSSATDSSGAWLEIRGVKARRVALLVQTCRGCGKVGVYWNGTLVGTVSLGASARHVRQMVAMITLPKGGPGTLRVIVLSTGRRVVIDGVGLSPV